MVMARPVFLVGPTGCGKSSLARTLAHLRGARIVELSFTGETAKNDLSASRRLVGGVTRWSVQAFLEALSRGDTVIVNEYNLAYPDVHSLINSLFDKGASVSLPDGSTYRMHPDARLIATGYLDGPGVKPLNEGVENRFGAIVAMEYLPVDEEVTVLAAVGPGLGRPALESCVRLIDYCRRLGAGKVETTGIAGLSRASQEALQSASRRAALTTAELVALARTSADDAEFLARLRIRPARRGLRHRPARPRACAPPVPGLGLERRIMDTESYQPSEVEAIARLILKDLPIRVAQGDWWTYRPGDGIVTYPPLFLEAWPGPRVVGALLHEVAEVLYSGPEAVSIGMDFGRKSMLYGCSITSARLLLNAVNDLRVNRLYLAAFPGEQALPRRGLHGGDPARASG